MSGRLTDDARRLLQLARVAAPDEGVRREVEDEIDRLDEPLRVAVAGRVKAGKSTLVNAMVGELIAPTDARECTRVVTWYRDGVTYRVDGVETGGERRPLRFDRDGGALDIDLGGRRPDELTSIEVTWPSARLREMVLVDTPGIDSISVDASARTEALLTGDDHPTPTDAVVYLLRHVHTGDLRFLEAFHDDDLASPNPVNSIGVLSRADEIGAARPDALESARRIAARWRADRRLGRLVQTVVPVAGLLAEAATTLRQSEFDALASLGRADRGLVDDLLVSTDRFVSSQVSVGVVDDERRALLGRLGLFGCRLAVRLVREGRCDSAGALAGQLLDASGVPTLRREIAERLTQRRDLLKARQAFAVARRVADVADRPDLLVEVERVVYGAHEFAELRVLNALRRGEVSFAADVAAEAEVLLGGRGTTAATRLGMGDAAVPDALVAGAREALARWQRRSEHPLATRGEVDAARVVVRTCEGLLVGASADVAAGPAR